MVALLSEQVWLSPWGNNSSHARVRFQESALVRRADMWNSESL